MPKRKNTDQDQVETVRRSRSRRDNRAQDQHLPVQGPDAVDRNETGARNPESEDVKDRRNLKSGDFNRIHIKRELGEILEQLGYSKTLQNKRIKIYDNAAKCLAKVSNRNWSQNIDVIIAGSRGEGMSNSLQSDLDVIMVQSAVKCYSDASTTAANNDSKKYVSTFELVQQDVPPGYAKLRLRHKEDDDEIAECYNGLYRSITRSLTDENYLKNDAVFVSAIERDGKGVKKEGWISSHYHHDKTNGPSEPLRYPLPFKDISLAIDYVQAFECVYPSFFEEWRERVQTKKTTWPSSETIEKVRKSKMFVVPVGFSRDAEEAVLQWRLSFTLAEIILVTSFSDEQIKAYAALKMLVKSKLKPICSDISSYLIKNVIFWVSEEKLDVKETNTFDVILRDAIKKLKECIESRNLPNYIIPSRNLLQDKLLDHERTKMISVLDQMCEEGVKGLTQISLVKEMYTPLSDDREEAMRFRNLSNEVVMAFFSITPEQFDEIDHKFHQAETADVFQEIFLEQVLPNIRQYNPHECFPLINLMDNKGIKRMLNEGFEKGLDKIWCN